VDFGDLATICYIVGQYMIALSWVSKLVLVAFETLSDLIENRLEHVTREMAEVDDEQISKR